MCWTIRQFRHFPQIDISFSTCDVSGPTDGRGRGKFQKVKEEVACWAKASTCRSFVSEGRNERDETRISSRSLARQVRGRTTSSGRVTRCGGEAAAHRGPA